MEVRLPDSPQPFDPAQWKLSKHGDSMEQKWADTLSRLLPEYESMWQRHIVPLTFRIYDPDHYFLRPNLADRLLDLADAHYTAAYHLVLCNQWLARCAALKEKGSSARRQFPTFTDSIYAFFAHSVSTIDAALWFAHSTNIVLEYYRCSRAFDIQYSDPAQWGKKAPVCLRKDKRVPNLDAFFAIRRLLKQYRNLLLHERPVFIHNLRMPKAEVFDKYAGLAGIGRLALGPERFKEDFEDIGQRLEALLRLIGLGLRPVWRRCLQALDGIKSAEYQRGQRALRRHDRSLVSSRFEQIGVL